MGEQRGISAAGDLSWCRDVVSSSRFRAQDQKYNYVHIELYHHFMDDGTEVKAHHWKFEKYNAQVSTHQEENDYLRNFWLRGKEIEVLEYAQDLGHCYSNCHSLTFTDGKAGWMAKPEVVEKILKGNGFKEVLRGNFATDSPQWPTHHAPSQHRQAEASCI